MNSIFSLIQLAMTAIMFLSVIAMGIAHAVGGHLSPLGSIAIFVFAYLTWTLVRLSWKEYLQEKNK